MIIRIDEYSDVPIYLQIRNQIVMGISSGELKAGEQLPTVRALALEIGINTMTVSKTYQLLKSEGYIMTDRKNGARVRKNIAQSGVISEENKTELRRIVSECRLAGVAKSELNKLIDEFYKG
ncbi:MAG: GntR family transcriptional regulator [Clostridiales bacterium]|nr:GntR family transcriptional regulator [Clostridiales bacterium]